MGRFMQGRDRSNGSLRIGSEDGSRSGEEGVELAIRSQLHAQSGSPANTKDLGHRKAGRESDMVGFLYQLIQLQDLFVLMLCSRIEAPLSRRRQPLID